MFENFITARRAGTSFTSARRSSPERADDGGFLFPSPEEAAPYFTEPEKIMLECGLATLIAGGATVFSVFAFTGDWGTLLASSGTGLGAGVTVLSAFTAVSCFKKLAEYQGTVTTVTRHLYENVYHWKQSTEFWRRRAEEITWNSAAGLAEAAGAGLDRAEVPAANPKVIYPEWRR
jgi:hypothetical protein